MFVTGRTLGTSKRSTFLSRKTKNNAISTTRTLNVGRLTQASYRPLSTALVGEQREASHGGHRCCRPTRPRPPAPFDETSARLTTTTTEVRYRAQPGSPRRFPARHDPCSLSLFSVGSEDLWILGLAHVKVNPRKCTTTKFPPSSSIMAALLTSTLPPPSAHWYPYCKQLLLERLLLVF